MRRWIYSIKVGKSRIKFSRKEKPEVAYCPKCFHKLNFAGNTSGWLNSEIYLCPSCGYSGSFYVTKDLETREESDQ